MSKIVERFLSYVKFNTQSRDASETQPSTPGQMVFACHLLEELRGLGAKDLYLSPGAYVYATLPASAGREREPALGFLAHLDTSEDASGANVRPSIITYLGGAVQLGRSSRKLDPTVFPELNRLIGRKLIVTDGTTLLGADDKIGLAVCMCLAETLLAPNAPAHPEIRLCFTPDEEIGRGTAGFEPARFGARRAYTVDGGPVDEFENANFNAARATFEIAGVSVHPGSAKNAMINAVRVAGEILARLPVAESPERTEGREGFFHPTGIEGSVSHAKLGCLVRDHDAAKFAARKRRLEQIAEELNRLYGQGVVTLTVKDQYYNMEEGVAKVPELTANAVQAIRSVGLEPKIVAIRGGTDGAELTRKGIPCPNLGTGGRNFHGECEYAIVEEMEQAYRIVLWLATH